jgi:aspartyl-tRNA(Asn)/glutamyl-tRNA(Gln) amidotransferase subunit A
MSQLHHLSIADLAALVRARRVSPLELVEHALRRIDALNPSLNAFTTVASEQAIEEARLLTDEIARGHWRGPLHGIPIGVKDLTDTAGIRTTYGSRLFADHVPVADAEPVARLRAAGAVVVGKTATHEFAFGATTDNPHFGPSRNPWQLECVPGGSSGGAGAAVAAGLVPLSTGSDTGGSIRIPAAACGCVGFKPTHGRVSLRGTYPLAPSLDHVGPIARSSPDCALAMNVLSAFDREDPWSRRFTREDFSVGLERPLRGTRIGVDRSHCPAPLGDAASAALDRALAVAAESGAEIIDVHLPDAAEVTLATSMLLLAEAHVQHRDQLAAHRPEYGLDVRAQLDASAAVDVPGLVRALHARERITRQIEFLFEQKIDAFVLPTMAVTAPRIDATTVQIGELEIPVGMALASFTLLADLTRLPTIAIPCGLARDGLPTSVQLTGPYGADANVVRMGHAMESALWPPSERRPPASSLALT